jgi:hypothetical protein
MGSEHSVLTWNVAAINNNPFEYWIDHSDPRYKQLMTAVGNFVSMPGDGDVLVEAVFTPAMYAELHARMEGLGWVGVVETAQRFRDDFSKRPIITGFLKDRSLGKKRLASWPDRLTNTIAIEEDGSSESDGGEEEAPASASASAAKLPLCRPTVINCFNEPLPSGEVWFKHWVQFMFATPVRKNGARPCDLLAPIIRSKYVVVNVVGVPMCVSGGGGGPRGPTRYGWGYCPPRRGGLRGDGWEVALTRTYTH